jgi:signal transduction histidine kinase
MTARQSDPAQNDALAVIEDLLRSQPEILAGLATRSGCEPTDIQHKAAWLAEQGMTALLVRLVELETEFAAAVEREKLAALKELAYGASHEINNPLANISTRAQALLRDETDPERRRKLATINSQAFRAHEMISDMMLFAKPPKLVREREDVVGLVERVVAELLPLAREQGTNLVQTPAAGPLELSVDSCQLAVAFKALASNALEALGCGGKVEFAVAPAEVNGMPGAKVVVSDTGPGISAEVRRHLFDPFYSGREAGRGLGFGLAKCWRIVTDHGGQIDVASEPGLGATFTIWLPAVDVG